MSGLFGQLVPPAGVWTDLYLVPANAEESMRVIIANLGAVDTTFRVAASKNGAALIDAHRITGGDEGIQANTSGSTIAFVVTTGDIIRVYSANGQVAFTATGTTRVL